MFNSTGQCGFHNNLTSSLVFLKENQSETVVTVEPKSARHFRRLASAEDLSASATARSLSSAPRMLSTHRSSGDSQHRGPALTHELSRLSIEVANGVSSIQLSLEATLGDVKSMRRIGSEDLDIWSIEIVWRLKSSPFLGVQMEGASSFQKTVGDLFYTTWRLFPSRPILTVSLLPTFAGSATVKVGVNIKQNRGIAAFTRNVEMHTADPDRTPIEPTDAEVISGAPQTVSSALPQRRLTSDEGINRTFVANPESPPRQIDLWTSEMSSVEHQPLVVTVASMLDSIGGALSMNCESQVSTFDSASAAALDRVQAYSTEDFPFVNGIKLVHTCLQPLRFTRHPAAAEDDIMLTLQVKLKESGAEFISCIATISIHWSVLPVSPLPGSQAAPVGSLDVLLGATISIQVDGEALPNNTRIEIAVSDCSQNLTYALIHDADASPMATSVSNCVIAIQSEFPEQALQLPLKLQLGDVTHSDTPGSIQVTTATFEEDDDLGSWSTISKSISTIDYQFCALGAPKSKTLYALERTLQEYDLTRLASLLLKKPRDSFSTWFLGLSLVWSSAPAGTGGNQSLLGTFFVNGTQLTPQKYNDSAVYVEFASDNVSTVSFLPANTTPGAQVYFDVILKYSISGSSGCFVYQNARLVTVPHTGEPQVATPYVYSTKVYEGASATVNIPLIEVADQLEEFVELKIQSNVSSLQFQVEANDSAIAMVTRAMNSTNLTTVIVQRTDLQHRIEHMAIKITPHDSFVGVVRFDVEVTAIRDNDADVDNVEQYSSDFATIYQVVLEWFDSASFTSIQPSPPGTAVYRSLPMQLRGNSTLSFSYRLSSGNVACKHYAMRFTQSRPANSVYLAFHQHSRL